MGYAVAGQTFQALFDMPFVCVSYALFASFGYRSFEIPLPGVSRTYLAFGSDSTRTRHFPSVEGQARARVAL